MQQVTPVGLAELVEREPPAAERQAQLADIDAQVGALRSPADPRADAGAVSAARAALPHHLAAGMVVAGAVTFVTALGVCAVVGRFTWQLWPIAAFMAVVVALGPASLSGEFRGWLADVVPTGTLGKLVGAAAVAVALGLGAGAARGVSGPLPESFEHVGSWPWALAPVITAVAFLIAVERGRRAVDQ